MSSKWARQDTPLVREILVHAVQRLARHKPEQAWKHWQALAKTHHFDAQQKGIVLRRIALSGALSNHPQAVLWMASVPEQAADAAIHRKSLYPSTGT